LVVVIKGLKPAGIAAFADDEARLSFNGSLIAVEELSIRDKVSLSIIGEEVIKKINFPGGTSSESGVGTSKQKEEKKEEEKVNFNGRDKNSHLN